MREIVNPYPGIRSFEPYESEIFFGREKHVNELINILLEKKFVAILGASGTGKSSLVKAGIIPHLQKHDEGTDWQIIHFKPGSSPIENLLFAIEPIIADKTNENDRNFTETLRSKFIDSESVLYSIFSEYQKKKKGKYFLYIDQFEEIFRFVNGEESDEAQAWIKNLIYLFNQEDIPVYLTLSLRSDYLGRSVAFSGLPELINEGNYLVPQMEKHALENVIRGPLKYFGVEITDALVNEVLTDVDNSPEHLLIMQHALMRTYQEWKRNDLQNSPIDKHHYKTIGTVKNAISIHGEQVYNELIKNEDKQVAEKIFKALLQVGNQESDMKIPVKVHDLAAIVGTSQEKVIEITDHFRSYENAFLHPHPNMKLNQFTIIDLAHETILRNWERGRIWIEEESNAAELYVRLAKAAELYQIGKGGLWINPELSLALNWKQSNEPNSAWAERYDPEFDRAINFLNHSHKEHLEDLRRKDEAQKRKIALFRNFAAILGAATVVAVFLSIMALNLKFEAESSEMVAVQNEKLAIYAKKDAEEKSKEAISHQKISFQQQKIAEQQKILADQQKLFAVKQQKIALEQKLIAENQSRIATNARNEAVEQKKQAEEAKEVAVEEREKADSLRVIAEKQTEISERLRKLAVARSVAIQSVKIQQSATDQELAKVLAKEAFHLNKSSDGPPYEPDIYTALSKFGNANNVLTGHDDQVRSIQLVGNQQIMTVSDNGQLFVWDFANGKNEEVIRLRAEVESFAYTPNHGLVFMTTDLGQLYQIDTKTKKKKRITPKSTFVNKVSTFGEKLFFVKHDSSLMVNNIPFSFDASKEVPLPAPIHNYIISENGKTLACALKNNELVLLDIENNWKVIAKYNNQTPVQAMAFKTGSKLLAFSDDAYELKIWNYSDNTIRQSNIKHQTGINAIAFSATNSIIASCSYDGTIRFWDYENGEKEEPVVIPDHDSWVHSIVFLPDGQTLISAGEDRTVRKWCVLPEKLAQKIQTDRELSQEEREKYVGKEVGSNTK